MTKQSGSFSEFVHSWRYFIWALLLGVGIVLFYLEEDWRGRWTWETYRRQLSAEGEHIDPSHFIPERVPDDKNFAMTPFLAPLFDFVPGSQKWMGANPVQRINGFAPKFEAASRFLQKPK